MSEISPSQAAAPQENKMGVMPCGKLLAGMAIPMMISMLVQAFYNVVDSIFVAQLSEDALNAVSLAFPLQNLMIAFGTGTAVGINALLSRSLGEKNQEMVDKAANTGIFLALCNFVVFALIGVFFSRTFFEMQAGGEQIIVDYGVDYASICLGLSIGIFSQFCFERLLQSTGRTTLAMITQLTGAIINIIMDPLLIFGVGPFPKMGIAGAAWATVLGQIVAAVLAVLFNLTCNHDIHPTLRGFRPNGPVIRNIYSVGAPSIILNSIGSVMTFGMNKILIAFDLGFMQTVAYILVIAALVQFVEMFLKKNIPTLYTALGVYLPLITTNCAVLGVALLNTQNEYNFIESVVYGITGGLGFLLAIFLFAAIREQLEVSSDNPKAFDGFPIALVTAGLIALAFMGFSGLKVW